MDISYHQHLPQDFHPQSRVWIYQASRMFMISEALEMEDMINEFIAQWKSHGAPVKGYANLFFGRFFVVMADESNVAVGGCSTDSSVHLVKAIEQRFKTDMFNRQLLAFIVKDKIELIPLSQLGYAVENGFINEHTLYFNNTVLTKKELEDKWLVPAKESWLASKITAAKEQ
ncbi:MAG: hypothetical protein WAT19_07590 [Ferruginibacter sp.]